MTSRHAGLMIPLFSLRTASSWGIGELPDVAPLATWMAEASLDQLMLLPLGPMTPADPSPYSGSSTMAIEPMFIALDALEDFAKAGGKAALPEDIQRDLDAARSAPRVSYPVVRRVKARALALAFARFFAEEWPARTARGAALADYIERERWWLDDYALFQALSHACGGRRWRDWPAPLRDRDPGALESARRDLGPDVLRQQYQQWIAETQWQDARAQARASGVRVWGDLPFVAGGDSADVWARPGDYLLDVSVGTPPDAFSADGQDWGMPMYHWQAMAESGFTWIRERASRMAALFDGVRIDHLVGFYRTFGRTRAGDRFFNPPDERTQAAQGAAVLDIFRSTGAELVAEDLGTVPDFVRASMATLDVPGCKVLRWERLWHAPGQPFLEPATYPPSSAAMTGTHDTTPLSLWWDQADLPERAGVLELSALAPVREAGPSQRWSDALRDALLDLAYGAASRHLFLPLQDVFGWPDRINVPGTVTDENWSWIAPWPVDRCGEEPEARDRARHMRALAERHRRGPA